MERIYRVTVPSKYPRTCAGYKDPAARQGFYVRADDEPEALRKARRTYAHFIRDIDCVEIDRSRCAICGAWEGCVCSQGGRDASGVCPRHGLGEFCTCK